MKILITGATGFVGEAVVQSLGKSQSYLRYQRQGFDTTGYNTLLLKSQYNHINHLDQKFNEVIADVASLKGEVKLLGTRVNERFNTLEVNMARFETNISLKISEAINTNMRFSIGLIVMVLKLADMFVK